MTDYYDGIPGADALGGKQHHLLRHSLPVEERGESVLRHFETDSVPEAFKSIKKMSQRDLQAKFKAIYGAKTFSNNNNWLRRKLFEAIGVDPSKGAGKKPAGGAQKRRKAATKVVRPAAPRAFKPAFTQEMDNSAAEALLALGDVCMQLSEESEGLYGEEEESEGQQQEAPYYPAASADTGSGVARAPGMPGDEEVGAEFETKHSISLWCGGAADREVPGNRSSSPGRDPSPFERASPKLQLSSDGSQRREEEEGETEPAPCSLFQPASLANGAAPAGHGSRANSSSMGVLDSAELSHMASNVGHLYAWLLARQQQHQQAAAPSAALLPQPLMPLGAFGHPAAAMVPHPAYPIVGGMLPGALPMAPPLFNLAAAKRA